jgi:hypothetical protein
MKNCSASGRVRGHPVHHGVGSSFARRGLGIARIGLRLLWRLVVRCV